METVAVIAEFNPFHTGHAHLLREIRAHLGKETAIAVIMSGAFVQRGEPAIFDKWQRAAWAVRSGADAVVELPAVYALSSAAGFAFGGVSLASHLGCTYLACGVERGTADDFLALARCAAALPKGHPAQQQGTAGQALSAALSEAMPEKASLLREPNALLAFEYAKAITTLSRPLTFLTLPRRGRHDAAELGSVFASASALRRVMTSSPDKSYLYIPYIPPENRVSLNACLERGAFTDYRRYEDFAACQGRLLTPVQLKALPAFTEGLENRWHRVFAEACTYGEALAAIKTKRYAYSRLCRMGAYTLLQPTRTLMDQSYEEGPQYARLLALNGRGAAFLHEKRGTFPVISKVRRDIKRLSPLGRNQLALDFRASDLQSLCFTAESARQGRQDFYHSPLFLAP